MEISASGGCHQPIHQVPRRSSVSSEHSSKLRFSRFFSFIPAGARLFCLGVLALLLILPLTYRVGAVTFSFSGFQESDVYMVPGSPWTFQSNTSCFYFDPSEASWSKSVPGRFLYPDLVQMKDPVTKQVKSFSTTFIYQIQIQEAHTSGYAKLGPGMSFIVVPDNVTVGAAEDYMKLLTLGVELDTFRNPEFNDPNDNHIGVNLASMNSTFIVYPFYFLASVFQDVYIQIWIDYFEPDSRMDIYYARYREGRPAMPQGSQTGVDLSLLVENMYIGFSTAKGIESDNVPIVCAWSFSNDGIPAPPIDVPKILQTFAAPTWTPVHPIFGQLFLSIILCILEVMLILGVSYILWRRQRRQLLLQLGTRFPHPFEVEKCTEAMPWLCKEGGIPNNSCKCKNDYTDTVCTGFASKRRRSINQGARMEIGVMAYINKLLRLLFALSGILIILLSIILDNFFNDKPIQFTAFAILILVMISLGLLASGWFPRIPLRFIAFLKRCGFLQHVVACSPWHDNVITNFCGKICTLKPLEQDEGTRLFEFPMSVQNFLYDDQFPPQGTTFTTYSHSKLDSDIQDCQAATSLLKIEGQDVQEVFALNPQSQDFKTNNVPDQSFMSEMLERPHVVMATSQVSSPTLEEAPSRVEDISVEAHHSPFFYVLGNEQAPMLEFDGPKIQGFPLKVQVLKNMSTRDLTFDLSCSFRNKKTRRMNLTTERLSNLVQNMCQWVEMPYPIAIDESSDILHFMAIQDILWVFTKSVYNFNSTRVEHRFVAGIENGESVIFVLLTLVSFVMGMIPLVLDKTSNWFLLFLIIPVAYVFMLMDIPYYFRSLLCPIYIKIFGFNRLYKSKSSYIWCNEFMKRRIANPKSFWIDQEYANKFFDGDNCFDIDELVKLPGNPARGESFRIACQGWPEDDPRKQHDYELEVNFDTFNPGDTRYTRVKLSFSKNGNPRGTRIYSSVEIRRLQLIEKLFYCYSNPSFGGYVETIRPCPWSQSYLGNCRRFLDICDKIITDSTMPIPWEATTKSDCQFIIGVPF